MAINAGLVVPTNTIRAGGRHETITLVAEAGITPGDAVKFGSSQAQVVVCGVTDPLFIGVADLNKAALEDGNDPLTTDYVAEDIVVVITKGRVRAIADSAVAVTRGTLVMTGATVGTSFEDIGGGTFDEVAGRALTSAAVTDPFILELK